jgi:hypothetical protein
MKCATRRGLMKRVAGWGAASMIVIGLGAASAMAEPAMIKQAKEAGLPVQNCQYCHTEKVPKKETFKPEELNARGKWMLAEKEKRKASKSDPAWLKEYPGGAK